MTYMVTAKANFDNGLQHVWEFDNYEDARKCAAKKQLVHKRLHADEKLYANVTIHDENGIRCSF